jgi:probable HAF family extracellular repeat protein
MTTTNRITWMVCALLAGAHPAAGQVYAVDDLGTLGGQSSDARSINAIGQVVGGADTGPFLWTNGRMHRLVGPIADANGINTAGQIVGDSTILTGPQHAFLGVKGHWQDLGTLGGDFSSAYAINDAGQVAGDSSTRNGASGHPFLWIDGRMRDLGCVGGARAINAAGQVVGWAQMANGHSHAFLWTQGVLRDLGTLGGDSIALGINAAGQVVGSWSDGGTDSPDHPFLWTHGKMVNLGGPGEWRGAASSINGKGQVVGGAQTETGQGGAFLYTEARGMLDLNTRIDPALGWELLEAHGINDGGQIAGDGYHHGKLRAFRLTPVFGGCLRVTPPRLRFAGVPSERRQTRSLVLRNVGRAPVAGRVERLSAPFRLVAGSGNYYLKPGQSKRVRVELASRRSRGMVTGRLTITSSEPTALAVNVRVAVRVR